MNKQTKTYLIHSALFIATLITTTIAGAEWQHGKFLILGMLSFSEFTDGFYFSIPFLTIFLFHEFGHYLSARKYNIKSSLPFFIPLPPIPSMIGTLGAVIKLKERVKSTTQNFDIGIAGPLAGFVIAMGVLFYGYTHLPSKEYVYEIHPEYHYFGEDYANYVYHPDTVVTRDMMKGYVDNDYLEMLPDTVFSSNIGPFLYIKKSLMIALFENYIVPEADKALIPNPYEFAHYPFLFAGFLALFFTALNLLPIGQLDGGHVVYGLFGKKGHTIIASIAFFGLLFYAGLGFINLSMPVEDLIIYIPLYIGFLYICLQSMNFSNRDRLMYATIIFSVQFLIAWQFPKVEGYTGWLLLAFLIGRFVGVFHPPSEKEEKLTDGRMLLGWISLIILILCFTPAPMAVG
ncbi:MAG: site-2 protease family protein [Cyclobacteriaceae bacterium]|nr:site-2 protease family protein [Cyclobacteriaceae bacterium]